jgi:hypothetical protein
MILSSQSAPEKNVLSNRLHIPLRISHPPSPHGSRRISLFPSYWSRSGNSSQGGGAMWRKGLCRQMLQIFFYRISFRQQQQKCGLLLIIIILWFPELQYVSWLNFLLSMYKWSDGPPGSVFLVFASNNSFSQRAPHQPFISEVKESSKPNMTSTKAFIFIPRQKLICVGT